MAETQQDTLRESIAQELLPIFNRDGYDLVGMRDVADTVLFVVRKYLQGYEAVGRAAAMLEERTEFSGWPEDIRAVLAAALEPQHEEKGDGAR